MTDTHSSVERDTIQVVRDATFVRFVADEAIVAVVGRDLEIGFLQYGPMFTHQTDYDQFEKTESRNVVTEVARMRMSYADFLQMTMSFIRSGIVEGRLKADAIQHSFSEWANEVQVKPDVERKPE